MAATAPRPLRAALDALGPSIADLLYAGPLADFGPVAANLRALANLDPVKRARKLGLAQRAVRAAPRDPVAGRRPADDDAIARHPRPGPLCAAVLALTAWPPADIAAVPRPRIVIALGDGGAVPGHPTSSLLDDEGPWAEGWRTATELDPAGLPTALAALRTRVEAGKLAALEVPDAWLAGRRRSMLWARAHRPT